MAPQEEVELSALEKEKKSSILVSEVVAPNIEALGR